ncbi:tRNA (5-methylaminomethyl-2-thiouridine)(34)-methyltransferase MnmD [Lewinella sp. JB7]|uniref:tRNA (5-methylaminomethyl-2-thiouridine)(34)-methyltransferase MnmD n=1 Tax=Lewinella sp. JB7 TaxID=2962887 RepID=UPI0020C97DB3|nr:tRNA (5-methylaminomethyl-2-thiouridine)(34)-methyltransferase MnmD [Lewinella sp. JB7]MCP9235709.1 tRNA (5-methylaminomethyl-2-thiouridine)(34)-methyltransferase MnmD [Lewinella sp. JB7]
MDSPTPFLTADGSHSLRSPAGISYHSTHGAIQESQHIFIEYGLLPLLRDEHPRDLNILEMGFGTGLNALLVRAVAANHPGTRFAYTTFERYPVGGEQVRQLNYPARLGLPAERFFQLHDAPWGEPTQLDANFVLHKRREDFLGTGPHPARPVELIIYDAFAPENQPELWTPEAMRQCYAWLKPGGRLLTYCAKGQFKRNLRVAGFRVERLPGPVGKREITRAFRD